MEQKEISRLKNSFYTYFHSEKLLNEVMFNCNNKILYREVSLLENNGFKFRGITFSEAYYMWRTFFNPYYRNGTIYNKTNIYVGQARILKLPNFPFGKDRKKYTTEFYKEKYKDLIVFYDIFLDFDIKLLSEIPALLHEIRSFLDVLIEYKLKFELVFSGSRGFKILIWNNTYNIKQAEKIVHNLQNKFKFKFLDPTCTFCFPSKLMKMNFTLAYDSKSKNLKYVFPLKLYNFDGCFEDILKNKNFSCFNAGIYGNRDVLFNMLNPDYDAFFLKDGKEENIVSFVNDFNLLKGK